MQWNVKAFETEIDAGTAAPVLYSSFGTPWSTRTPRYGTSSTRISAKNEIVRVKTKRRSAFDCLSFIVRLNTNFATSGLP
jgi:hypothetical protein